MARVAAVLCVLGVLFGAAAAHATQQVQEVNDVKSATGDVEMRRLSEDMSFDDLDDWDDIDDGEICDALEDIVEMCIDYCADDMDACETLCAPCEDADDDAAEDADGDLCEEGCWPCMYTFMEGCWGPTPTFDDMDDIDDFDDEELCDALEEFSEMCAEACAENMEECEEICEPCAGADDDAAEDADGDLCEEGCWVCMYTFELGCWSAGSADEPSFDDILGDLDDIDEDFEGIDDGEICDVLEEFADECASADISVCEPCEDGDDLMTVDTDGDLCSEGCWQCMYLFEAGCWGSTSPDAPPSSAASIVLLPALLASALVGLGA